MEYAIQKDVIYGIYLIVYNIVIEYLETQGSEPPPPLK
jgi:hypothetical protein